MKLVFFFLLTLLIGSNETLLNSDVKVIDIDKKVINLNKINIIKDSVLVVLWHYRCSPCIKELNELQEMQIHRKIQVVVVAINLNNQFSEEILLIRKQGWVFDFYFDDKKELQEYLISNKLMRKEQFYKSDKSDTYLISVPQSYLFIKRKLVANKMIIRNKKLMFEDI